MHPLICSLPGIYTTKRNMVHVLSLTEIHSDTQKPGTTCLRSHSQQRRAWILTCSYPLHGPFCSLNVAFLGFARPIFFPRYTIGGGGGGQLLAGSPKVPRVLKGTNNLFCSPSSPGLQRGPRIQRAGTVPLYHTPGWAWGHRWPNRVPAL